MNRLFLGLDGGRSTTTSVIGNEQGRVLGRGEAGPCDHPEATRDSLSAACRGAGLDPLQPRFRAACLGFSGGPSGKRAIVEQILTADELILTTDASVALTGATGGQPGIITIAGTGSIAIGRNAAGQTARAGGWGYLFGDEGGAFDMVRQALRAALRFEEGWGPATTLFKTAGTASVNDLLHLFYTPEYPKDRIASYSPLVDQAARDGDAVAGEIMKKAARELAAITSAVRGQLFAANGPVLVSWAGGVFSSLLIRDHFRALVETDAGCRCAAPLHSPAVGALIEAYRAAGLDPEIAGDVLRSHF